ncbi:MAG: biotin/lipoyl-containing protein [Gemmatimonadota bacterium]
MKYIVDVNGERLTVELDADGVRVDGRPVRAHLADVEGTPIHLVTIANEMHRVASRRGDARGRYALWMDGYRYEVEALDERMRAIRDLTSASETAGGPRPLLAPMPGLIVRIGVVPGERVEAGQGLVVMEAMKMENELRAPGGVSAVVKAIHAVPGQAVEKGALLVEFEQPE